MSLKNFLGLVDISSHQLTSRLPNQFLESLYSLLTILVTFIGSTLFTYFGVKIGSRLL